jgi:hypothetical protein
MQGVSGVQFGTEPAAAANALLGHAALLIDALAVVRKSSPSEREGAQDRRGDMVEVWITMALLGADLLGTAAKSAGHWWGALPFGTVWTPAGLPRHHPDLIALGLDCMPPSRDELRRAYRSAVKVAHPDVHGGSREAFLAVAAAFERLSGTIGGKAA